jgi:hypothetical protein
MARIHDLVSDSTDDDGLPAGLGCRTIRVFGLVDWDTTEVVEDIVLDGTANVPTQNAYVIVHRMTCLTWGDGGPNVGTITATARVDGTVTATVLPEQGQTHMAMYGIPSTQYAYLYKWYASLLRGNSQGGIDVSIRYNPIPHLNANRFIVDSTRGLMTPGSSHMQHDYRNYTPKFEGPGIFKISAVGNVNNFDVSAGFDLVLEDKII